MGAITDFFHYLDTKLDQVDRMDAESKSQPSEINSLKEGHKQLAKIIAENKDALDMILNQIKESESNYKRFNEFVDSRLEKESKQSV